MKKFNLLLILFALISFAQCNTPSKEAVSPEDKVMPTMEAQTEVAEEQMKPFYQGTILETIDAGGYSYLKIKENLDGHKHVEGHEHKDFWIAVERTTAKVGDEVRFQKELVTEQFYSKILDRTFDELMFASNLQHRIKD